MGLYIWGRDYIRGDWSGVCIQRESDLWSVYRGVCYRVYIQGILAWGLYVNLGGLVCGLYPF